jgi:sugar lactone lactonase YvrE
MLHLLLRSALVAFFFQLNIPQSARATDIITTLAGGGSVEGYEAGQANLALGSSHGVAISTFGEIYFSDATHNQVLKISPTTGLITIVAGNGARAFTGDGLPAPSASLNAPGALAFDAAGNLLIADRGNFSVRRVDKPSGLISTLAGTGLFTGQVVGSNAPAPLGDNGPATSATFGNLGALAVDATGAILVCDSGNSCVRKFTVGGNITTIAGTPGTSNFSGDGGPATAAKFNAPSGIAIDTNALGVIYIADSGNRRVRRIALDNTVNTIVGSGTGGNTGFGGDGGAASNAQIGSLGGLAFDSAHQLLITCIGANRVRKSDVESAIPSIVTVAGNGGADVLGDLGPATGAALSAPRDIAIDAVGNVFILDSGHQRIRRVDRATSFIDTIAGTGLSGFIGDRGPWQAGVLSTPGGAAFDAAGNLYIADTGDNAVRKIAANGIITTFAGAGTNSGLGDGGPAALASLAGPRDVCIFGTTLYIADTGNSRIRAVDLTTGLIRTYATVSSPTTVIANPAGVLFVAHDDQVDKVDLAGTVSPFVGDNPTDTVANPLGDGLAATNATLTAPDGLALNTLGDLFIADTGNNLIRKVTASSGLVSTFAGSFTATALGDGGPATSARLNAPVGVAVSGTRVFIADTGNARIRLVDLGNIATLCGNGSAGFDGDGDVIANATVNTPGRMFFNGANLVIADTGNNRIRQIVPALDLDLKLLSLSARLTFTVDKKTGQLPRGKDTVSVKASLSLPAGISTANLPIHVDIVELHQQTQFTALGKPPVAVKPAAAVATPFGFTLPAPPLPLNSKYGFTIKGTSVANGKPVPFSFSSAGTLREELGRAGYTDVTTPTTGTSLPVRVNVSIGSTTFTGVAATIYKATQGKTGSAVTLKPK